ncbi:MULTISPECIES: helix-turn-helix domain-containing protein [Streptomyces]|uniref:Helix-turn-helix transcriptional regulator n=1 Tax=Streptomyces evansiae TaxID=3075535 RepID=A0ABU2QSW4_9ACTN|nr:MULTISPECIES: helix-turn-helix transcriptional regulator [unclassified Streptomyces]MDT0407526.1 helix-turn-helix transcriptional regulator [Streptomyces sp. DSM 41979]MYQ61027.1 helix-turn-helix domain-containing protein [Streptomyces sp. SID4926]
MNIRKLNPESGPWAAYGARLRKLRQELGWRQRDLAERVGYAEPHISGVEIAVKKPTLKFSAAVDTAMGLTNTDQSFEREFRQIKFGALLQGFPEYVTHERKAVEIRLYEVGLVHGLLQTREYANVLAEISVKRGAITPTKAEERLTVLDERQAALVRTPPPLLFIVLDESCIRRPIGGPKVMARQLEHLMAVADLPNTVFQIAPFDMGERQPFNQPITILTGPDRQLMCYSESAQRGYLEQQSDAVVPLLSTYHQLQAEAPSQATSVAMIDQVRKGIS